jgi:translocation and assembly module TamB
MAFSFFHGAGLMKLLKYIGIFLCCILLVMVFIASPWGTRGVLSIVNSSLDDVDIEYGSGSLLSALSLERVSYVTPDLDIQLSKLVVDPDWNCVMAMQVCLSQLSAKSVGVKVTSTNTEEPTNSEPLKRITLPVAVNVDALDIQNIRVNIPGSLEVKIKNMSTKLSMFRSLQIDHLLIEGTRVVLPAANNNSVDTSSNNVDLQAIANWQYEPLQLPAITFPIVMQARQLVVNDVLVTQNKQTLVDIAHLQGAVDITPKQLTVKKLNVTSSLGEADLSATLSKQWQHKINLVVKSAENSPYPISGQLALKGNLKRSEVDLSTTGLVELRANGTINMQSEQLPISLDIDWQPIEWPLQEARVYIDKGALSLSGDLNAYQLALDTAIRGTSIPESTLKVRASGNTHKALIEQISIDTLGGNLTASGNLTLGALAKWQSNITFKDIQPQQFWPQLNAQVSGNVNVDGQYDGQNTVARVHELSASGDWLDYKLNASGEASFDSVEGIDVQNFMVQTGDNKLTLEGSLEEFEDIEAQLVLDAPNLSQLYPSFAGQAQFDAQIGGTLQAPGVSFSGSGSNITLPDVSVSTIATQGQLIWDSEKNVDIELQLTDGVVNQQHINNINLTLDGDAQNHQLRFSLKSDIVDLITNLHGSLSDTQWNGGIDVATVSLDAGQFSLEDSSPEIKANWASNFYQISPFCLREDDAQVCVNKALYSENDAQFDVKISSLPISPLLRAYASQLQGFDTDATLNLSANGQWDTKGDPIVNADLSLSPSAWTVKGATSPLQLDVFTLQLNTKQAGNAQHLESQLAFESEQLGVLNSDMTLQINEGDKPINGVLNLEGINVGALKQFIPDLTELTGTINGQVALGGNLMKPLLNGEVSLQDGAVAGSVLPSRINKVEQRLTLEGQAASLQGTFQFGNGTGEIESHFDWEASPKAVINVKGSDMEIDYQNIVRAKLSPDINVEFDEDGLSVKGDLSLPYARIKVRDLPATALSPSGDVILVNQEQAQTQVKDASLPIKLSLNVKIDPDKNNNVKVDAFGLTSNLQGALLLTQEGEVLVANGEVNLVDGRYNAYAQDLIIREGEIQFSGPIDSPYLYIEAVRDPDNTADDVVAGLRVQGSVSETEISVFSDPSMNQPEALSYLITGTGFDSSEETSSDTAVTTALIGFGLGKSENKVTSIGRKLGVEDLALNTTGAGDETKLSVSGNIAPGVQLRYGVGVFDSVSEVAIRYLFMPKLYLEAVSGTDSALDLYYQFTLGDNDTDKASKPN